MKSNLTAKVTFTSGCAAALFMGCAKASLVFNYSLRLETEDLLRLKVPAACALLSIATIFAARYRRATPAKERHDAVTPPKKRTRSRV